MPEERPPHWVAIAGGSGGLEQSVAPDPGDSGLGWPGAVVVVATIWGVLALVGWFAWLILG